MSNKTRAINEIRELQGNQPIKSPLSVSIILYQSTQISFLLLPMFTIKESMTFMHFETINDIESILRNFAQLLFYCTIAKHVEKQKE